MKKTLTIGVIAGLVFLVSCTDHEVIPPPVPLVDLDCLCEGTVTTQNGDSTISYSDTCTYSSTKTINTGSLSNAEYNTQVWNSGMNQKVELEMRSLYWSDDGSNNPTSTDWQAYFNGNMNPNYAPTAGDDGVVVRWTDPNGRVWTSDTGQVCLSSFTYNLFTYDSDTTGEYMEFDAVFHARLLNSDITPDSSICIKNFHMKSAFRRE
ncbi:MAG: hypothetical protein HUJ25_02635 [Crocinitomicaceae bacterium]|nr:hypothetical protein [Crocinitomicaceae bacterium]